MYAIAFKNPETGHVSYYTGKAGGDWVSPNVEDAFFAYTEVGVQYIGRKPGFSLFAKYELLAVKM